MMGCLRMNVKVTVASESSTIQALYGLHPYQRQVLGDIVAALAEPEGRVVAHLPTGAGKTRIASHVAGHMLNSSSGDSALVIWLASTEELCDQAAETLERAWQHVGQRNVTMNRFWGGHRIDLRQIEGGFLVAGLAKLWAVASQDNTWSPHLAQRTAGVIFDEAHQAVARTYSYLTEQLIGSRTPLLGLTATPGRKASLSDEDYALAEMFAHKKVSIDPKGHVSPVTYLIANGYLADPRFVTRAFTGQQRDSLRTNNGDYAQELLDELGRDRERNQNIVDWTADAATRHKRIIVFCPSVESVQQCGQQLELRGLQANGITATTPQDVRSEIIRKYRETSSTPRIILNYGVLTAGFDAPQTSCAIIARPTQSLVLYSQMVGRALRGPRVGGNRWAEILTVVDMDLPGFDSVTDAFRNWEELWQEN